MEAERELGERASPPSATTSTSSRARAYRSGAFLAEGLVALGCQVEG